MDIISIISTVFSIIGTATVLFRIIAPLTETKVDDKILQGLTKLLEMVSLNKNTKSLEIKLE